MFMSSQWFCDSSIGRVKFKLLCNICNITPYAFNLDLIALTKAFGQCKSFIFVSFSGTSKLDISFLEKNVPSNNLNSIYCPPFYLGLQNLSVK